VAAKPAVGRPAAVAPPRRTGRRRPLSAGGWRAIALAVFLALWQAASIPAGSLLLPAPLDVLRAFFELVRSGELLAATGNSLLVFLGGFGLSVLVGIPVGILMGGIRPLGEGIEIYVNGLNSTPRVAFIPLIILWFGLGVPAKIVVVFVTAVLPIVINTYAGVMNSDQELVQAARSFGARRAQIFRYIMLPAAVPYIVAGVRIGASLAMIGTVVAELYTALSGLGYLLAHFESTFQTAQYFAPVVVLVILGALISESLKILEHRLAGWKGTSIEL